MDQHRWLSAVVRGHARYYGVPTNSRALATFRRAVEQTWHRALQRRSQKARFEKRFALRPTPICHPWPSQRLKAP